MRKYRIKDENGNVNTASYIGLNHYADGTIIPGAMASYHRYFDNDDLVSIESEKEGSRHGTIGNVKEAYTYLREEIFSKEPHDLFDYAECIEQVVFRYFGNYYYAKKRLSYFPTDEEVSEGEKRGRVSDLMHKNMALCTERAMLSQNLLFAIGFDSVFKADGIIINGREKPHAYNLISHGGKYYIFDSTIPTLVKNKVNPIICEIPKEVYEKISNPNSNIGYSVNVKHIDPLTNTECDITYDAGRDNIYKEEKEYTKHLELE